MYRPGNIASYIVSDLCIVRFPQVVADLEKVESIIFRMVLEKSRLFPNTVWKIVPLNHKQ